MKDDRLLIMVNDGYALAIGRAVYVFGYLEWNAVWCCEAVKPGYVRKLGKKVAGQIACDLDKLAPGHPDIPRRGELVTHAAEFRRLIDVRNDIMHARPATTPDGSQQVNRNGVFLSLDAINDGADAFAACSIALSRFIIT